MSPLLTGDCLAVMAGMEPDSVDAIVTDPPYGLGFMGALWDDAGRLASVPPSAVRLAETGRDPYPRTGKGPAATRFDGRAFQAWNGRWATAALRVLKPGHYLLAFGGTRTVHRLTVALEDSGWIIRDVCMWCFSSGFPKSKATLKPAYEPIVWAQKPLSRVHYDHAGLLRIHHALAAILWLSLTPAKSAETPSDTACVSARVRAMTASSDGSFGGTDTFRSPELASTSSSIARSWQRILVAISDDGNKSTTATASRLTTGLRTLSSCLSPITSGTTMPPCGCLLDGSSSPVPNVASGSSAEWESSLAILRRTVPEPAIWPLAQAVAAVCAGIADELSGGLEAGSSAELPATPPLDTRPHADSRPIVLAKKPGPMVPLGIDAARIGTQVETWPKTSSVGRFDPGSPAKLSAHPTKPAPPGRWPANLVLTDALFDGDTPGVVGGGDQKSGFMAPGQQRKATLGGGGYHGNMPDEATNDGTYGDTGTYSRFFLVPKSSRSDREPNAYGRMVGGLEEVELNAVGPAVVTAKDWGDPKAKQYERHTKRLNSHATVKPLALMRHLVRLVTPPGGTVLDCFAGSGSTLIAAELEGFEWVGIEQEPEYVAIAEARLAGVQRGLGLDVAAPTPKASASGPTLGVKGKAGAAKFDGTYNGGKRYEHTEDQVGGYSDSGTPSRFFLLPRDPADVA